MSALVTIHPPLSSGVPQGSVSSPLLFSLYLLQLGSKLRKHGISFHYYTDDSLIYVPLKKNDVYSIRPLRWCLDDIKAWMTSNFMNFNGKKTEIRLFGGTTETPLWILGSLSQYIKPTITKLGVKVDPDLKFNNQMRAVVK